MALGRSPSSSTGVIESHGICIFWNHVDKARLSGACIRSFPPTGWKNFDTAARGVVLGGLHDLVHLLAREGARESPIAISSSRKSRHLKCTSKLSLSRSFGKWLPSRADSPA
jgi:hypothetical protein